MNQEVQLRRQYRWRLSISVMAGLLTLLCSAMTVAAEPGQTAASETAPAEEHADKDPWKLGAAADAPVVTVEPFIGGSTLRDSRVINTLGRPAEQKFLDGGKNYKLSLPKDVPVKNFWSVIAYNSEDGAWFKNQPKAGVASSDQGLKVNADGTIDIFFGPIVFTAGYKLFIRWLNEDTQPEPEPSKSE